MTLALLTLPVVIVATEEALSAVPNSLREGSYACGAGKWQTIRRIVLPHALPGIMTGMILAMARGAGEVAPLMLVGAVKLAPELPVDGGFPFLHPERSFMHLGFHIYDLGFQSPNSEAAKPMVFTTTLLLIAIIALLNVSAVWLRTRLTQTIRLQCFLTREVPRPCPASIATSGPRAAELAGANPAALPDRDSRAPALPKPINRLAAIADGEVVEAEIHDSVRQENRSWRSNTSTCGTAANRPCSTSPCPSPRAKSRP